MICRPLFSAVILSVCLFAFPAQSADHVVTSGKMELRWTLLPDTLEMTMKAPTEGWVAVGFAPSKGMKDANFILGYVKKGKAKVVDHYGTGMRSHKKDTQIGGTDDVTLISGTEADGITQIRFAIPLDSKDAKDRKIDPEKPLTLLVAYGKGRDSFRTKHTFRAALTVDLKTGQKQ